MLGIAVLLIFSWIILYWLERKSVLALGFLPLQKRLMQFLVGFLITALLCFSIEYAALLLSDAAVRVNESMRISALLSMLWWDFKSVFTEELLFRGALLLILIERLGAKKGILISAVAFGVYHWFSFGLFGQPVPMIVIFIGTGLMGYAWALAFAKTRSIMMPLGLHLGWNFMLNTIFSKGPLGEGLLLAEGGHAISDWYSLVGLWGAPLVIFLIVKFLILAEPMENTVAEEALAYEP